MPSLVHEIAVARLSRAPSLLHVLAERLLGKAPPAALRPVDSVIRLANPEEIHPDLVLATGKRGPWDAVEVQRRIDRAKARRWPVLVGLLQDQRRCMGDLWVITTSLRAAEWARTACHTRGPRGTLLQVEPVVLCLSPEHIEVLLDERHPSLAFFAAWAMQDRHGTEAAEVVERAFSITDGLPDALRREQERDILNVLNRRMVAVLKERIMETARNRESRWVKELREDLAVFFGEQIKAEIKAEGKMEGKAEGKQEALLAVLEARGLRISRAERAMVVGCTDLSTLDHWLARAVAAATTKDVLARDPVQGAKRARPGVPPQRGSGGTPRRAPAPRSAR